MATGASEPEIDAVERRLGVRIPPDLRGLLAQHGGSERWFGAVCLMIYATAALVDVNVELEQHPGLLVFASDGSRELIGVDLRAPGPPVVMVDITSGGWDEALLQAGSLGEFMEQRQRGEPLRWDDPYRSP